MEIEDKIIVISKRQDLGELYSFILNNDRYYNGLILKINFFLYPRDILIITQFIIHSSIKKCAGFLRIESSNPNIQEMYFF